MDDDFYNDNFYDIDEWYQPEQYEPDEYFLQAKEEIKLLYEKNRENVFYIRQLQVKLEKKYFHWVTYNVIESLLQEKFLKSISIPISTLGTPVHFLVHHSNRYPKRDINEITKIIDEYSQEHITKGCGHRAEDLFVVALARRGFLPKNKKVIDYNGRKWVETNHDLNYIFVKDNITFGCEIKNSLGYIEKKELEIKLKMYQAFNMRPLFIMRYTPKTYNNMIIKAGGYAMIFDYQIYELSQARLVEKIKNKVGLPVDCPKAIPEGIINRFENWFAKIQKR